MNQPVFITKEEYKKLVRRVSSLEKMVAATAPKKRKTSREVEPKYGSKAWWEWSEKQADEDIKAGRTHELRSVDDLDKPLHELFP